VSPETERSKRGVMGVTYAYQPVQIGKVKPIALVGENLLLLPEKEYYRVIWIEQIPPFVLDFGSISAGKKKEDVVIDFIKQSKNFLAQLRFAPLDDVLITVKQPGVGRVKYSMKEAAAVVKIGADIIEVDPCLHTTELFQWQDKPCLFDLENVTNYDTPMSRVLWIGIRYELEKIPKPPKFTVVFTEARGK